MLAMFVAMLAVQSCGRGAPTMSVEQMNAALDQIRHDCVLGGYLIHELEDQLFISAEPTIRQLPLEQAKADCARKLVQERLGRELQ